MVGPLVQPTLEELLAQGSHLRQTSFACAPIEAELQRHLRIGEYPGQQAELLDRGGLGMVRIGVGGCGSVHAAQHDEGVREGFTPLRHDFGKPAA